MIFFVFFFIVQQENKVSLMGKFIFSCMKIYFHFKADRENI